MATIRAGLVSLLALGIAGPAWAQSRIVPDDTLGAERSRVTQTVGGRPNEVIGGGARRGQNLFHSFEEFNVDEGRGAFFSSPDGLENIFSRVTGGSVSNILGTLGTVGASAPDLYLLNPNGILFGPTASLDVQGSFIATTASYLLFEDGFSFDADAPNRPPLLAISAPIGLGFQATPQPIINRSIAARPDGTPVGLEVPSGSTLALAGGNLFMTNGGRLTAAGGRVELGGLGTTGVVGLLANETGIALSFPAGGLSTVTLQDESQINVRGGSGEVVVNAGTFTVTNGSGLALGPTGAEDGGNALINADTVRFSGVGPSGFGSVISNVALPGSSGDVGDTVINARRVSFDGDRRSLATSPGLGFETGIQSQTAPGATGDAGDIVINTETLEISSTAGVRSLAYSDSQGAAGSVAVTAARIDLSTLGFIEVVALNDQAPGSVEIDTNRLSIRGGSAIGRTGRAI
ncbi:MAG: filamentous hemagglutinin N-terminal domain-containing protein, partial [Cyanobacteria bacterium P01_A01_bin.70]